MLLPHPLIQMHAFSLIMQVEEEDCMTCLKSSYIDGTGTPPPPPPHPEVPLEIQVQVNVIFFYIFGALNTPMTFSKHLWVGNLWIVSGTKLYIFQTQIQEKQRGLAYVQGEAGWFFEDCQQLLISHQYLTLTQDNLLAKNLLNLRCTLCIFSKIINRVVKEEFQLEGNFIYEMYR